ncbi:hypothetical protein V6N00_16620 [Tersicoccus sp. MR15.9]|uniref:hypothetical protein n=1 Tax=Tersicoccus mangrovi TaxID=3121635 RepID=UPI002FE64E20
MITTRLDHPPRRRRRLLGTSAVAAVIVLLTSLTVATPASASGFEWDTATGRHWVMGKYLCTNNGGTPTAVACFEGSGDYLDIGDVAADHQSVGVQWKTDYGRSGICVNSSGIDTMLESASLWLGNHSCNKDFREHHRIWIRAGRCNFSAVNCRNLANWTSWSGWLSYNTSVSP